MRLREVTKMYEDWKLKKYIITASVFVVLAIALFFSGFKKLGVLLGLVVLFLSFRMYLRVVRGWKTFE